MIRLIVTIFVILSIYRCSQAETYRYKNGLIIEAKSFKDASIKCFDKLTENSYPGEERGLDIIDLCANPKGNIK